MLLVAALLVVTYLAFLRMNKDVRRARMFIMADRVKRFLGAYTFAFVAITLEVSIGILGIGLPPAAAGAVVLFFLGALVCGSVELFLVVHPRKRKAIGPKPADSETARGVRLENMQGSDSAEGGTDAAR